MAVGLEGSGAVLRPPAGRLRIQYPLAFEDFRRTGKRVFYVLRRVQLLPTRYSNGRRIPIPRRKIRPTEKALRAEVAEVLENRSHLATSLLNRKGLRICCAPTGNNQLTPERAGSSVRARSAPGEGLRRRAGPVG